MKNAPSEKVRGEENRLRVTTALVFNHVAEKAQPMPADILVAEASARYALRKEEVSAALRALLDSGKFELDKSLKIYIPGP